MSKQHSFLSRRFFGLHNCKLILYVTGKLKVFPSALALLEPFFSCVPLVKHQCGGSWKAISLIIRRLLLQEYCRKARKLAFPMFIWRLSSIFDLGLCVLIGHSELSTLRPVPGLLIKRQLGPVHTIRIIIIPFYPKKISSDINSIHKYLDRLPILLTRSQIQFLSGQTLCG